MFTLRHEVLTLNSSNPSITIGFSWYNMPMVEKQPGQRSEASKTSERSQFIMSVPKRAKEIIRDPSFLQYTRDHINEFRQ